MGITMKTGLYAALVWIIIRLICFYAGIFEDSVEPFVFMNMFGVTAAITIGLYLHKRSSNEESNAMNDIKNGMKAGVPYAFIVSIFIYFYYSKINPDYTQSKLNEIELKIDEALADPVELAKIRKDSEGYEVLSVPEIKSKMMSGPRSFYAAGSTMTISMLALLLWATMNSILIAIVFRRMIFKR